MQEQEAEVKRCQYIDQHGHQCVNDVKVGEEEGCVHLADVRKCSGAQVGELEWQVCQECGTSHPYAATHKRTPKMLQREADRARKWQLSKAAPGMVVALEKAAQLAQRIVDYHEDLKKDGNTLQIAAIEIREICDAALKEARGD